MCTDYYCEPGSPGEPGDHGPKGLPGNRGLNGIKGHLFICIGCELTTQAKCLFSLHFADRSCCTKLGTTALLKYNFGKFYVFYVQMETLKAIAFLFS